MSCEVDLCREVNQAIDVSRLPEEVRVSSMYDLAFVSASWSPEFSYLSQPLIDLLAKAYRGSRAQLADVGLDHDGPRFFAYEVNEVEFEFEFDENTVDRFLERTGLHFFVLRFEKDGSLIIGLDLDFVLVLSRKETGFVAANGGLKKFRDLTWKIFNSGESGMDEKVFRTLDVAVYGAKTA